MGTKKLGIFILMAVLLVGVSVFTLQAQDQGTIKIGFLAPLTGFAAADGASALHGAQIAVDFINGSGGINGKKIELVYYDDAAKADQASTVARKLIEQDKVVIGISGTYSTATRAAAQIFQASGIPLISAYAVHPSIVATGNLIFRVGMGADKEGIAGAVLAAEVLGAKRIAILTMDNDFGTSLSDYFKKKIQSLNQMRKEAGMSQIEIVFEKKYSLGETEFRGVLAAIRAKKPDLIWATAYYEEAANLVSQARELGIKVPIIGQEGYDSPKFIELGGDATNGTIIVTDLNRDSKRPIVQRFLDEYQKRAGVPADMVGASAFDAVEVAAYALAHGGTSANGIAQAINGLKDFDQVVTGPFMSFKDRAAIRPIEVQIVQAGAFHHFMTITDPVVISPAGS